MGVFDDVSYQLYLSALSAPPSMFSGYAMYAATSHIPVSSNVVSAVTESGWRSAINALAANPSVVPTTLVNLPSSCPLLDVEFLASNPSLPSSFLEALYVNRSSFKVRESVLKNGALGQQFLMKHLHQLYNAYRRLSQASPPSVPAEQLMLLTAASANPMLPLEGFSLLFSLDTHSINKELLANVSCPEMFLYRFADTYGADVAVNVSCPSALLKVLAASSDTQVVSAVARNPATPSAVLSVLSTHPSEPVRVAVCSNSNCDEGLFDVVSADLAEDSREMLLGARFGFKLVDALDIDSVAPHRLLAAALNPEMSVDLAARLFCVASAGLQSLNAGSVQAYEAALFLADRLSADGFDSMLTAYRMLSDVSLAEVDLRPMFGAALVVALSKGPFQASASSQVEFAKILSDLPSELKNLASVWVSDLFVPSLSPHSSLLGRKPSSGSSIRIV